MVESYKYKSKIATAVGGIATIISVLGVDQLQALFPTFGKYIPAIVALATWYCSQSTEDKRVDVAQQMVHEEYAQKEEAESESENVVVNLTLDGEDIIKDEVDDDVPTEDVSDDGGA